MLKTMFILYKPYKKKVLKVSDLMMIQEMFFVFSWKSPWNIHTSPAMHSIYAKMYNYFH